MTQHSDRQSAVGLVILHHDLRVHDNATLAKASAMCDALLVVYCEKPLFRPTLNRGQPYHIGKLGKPRQQFLHETLTALDGQLQALGNRLLTLKSKSHFDKQANPMFGQLSALMTKHQVTHVFVSQTCDYNQNQGYQLLKRHLPSVQWHESVTATLFDTCPMQALPKSFTPFRKKVEATHNLLTHEQDLLTTPTPSQLPALPLMSEAELAGLVYPPEDSKSNANDSLDACTSPFVGGEDRALAHVEAYFASSAPSTYKQTRNALDMTDEWSYTTRLSPWLANGSLSVRAVVNRLRAYERDNGANDSTYWIWFELLWREYFYWYAVQHGKRLFAFRGVEPSKQSRQCRSCFYGERFERWKNGSTPYPIVNACMNQLKATGYMSNRGRQLVASCFVHELGLDWRYGASYFESQLIDYDVASNWGNWQYLAGVGADPRGSRKFNLDKQTKTYDPNGEFIAKWGGQTGDTVLDSVDAADWYV